MPQKGKTGARKSSILVKRRWSNSQRLSGGKKNPKRGDFGKSNRAGSNSSRVGKKYPEKNPKRSSVDCQFEITGKRETDVVRSARNGKKGPRHQSTQNQLGDSPDGQKKRRENDKEPDKRHQRKSNDLTEDGEGIRHPQGGTEKNSFEVGSARAWKQGEKHAAQHWGMKTAALATSPRRMRVE